MYLLIISIIIRNLTTECHYKKCKLTFYKQFNSNNLVRQLI